MKSAERRGGSVAVEAAIMLLVLFAVASIASDMHRISIERTRIESTANSMALNISAQNKLTRRGLDALAEVAMQGHEEDQQIVILNVKQSGIIAWQLERGEEADLCEVEKDGDHYGGDLPEDVVEDSDEDPETFSMVVVLACRGTKNIRSFGGISMPDVVQVQSVYRATSRVIALDKELQEENMITADSEQEG